jgi:NADPH:quinone reductase-like Zn-dependent oxidoreductase
MKYAPVNPSDINFFQGYYGIRKEGTPIVGFEGAGVIVEAENKDHRNLVGRTVSVLANMSNGTFSTHIASNSM